MVKEHPLDLRSWPWPPCPTPTTDRSPKPLEIDKALTLRRQCTDALWFVPRGFVWTFVHLRIKFTSHDWHQLWTSIVKTHNCWMLSLSGIEWSVCLCVLFSCCCFLYRQLCVSNVFVCYKVLNEAFVCVYCFRVVVSCIANCALAMCLFVIRAWPSFGVGL